MRRRDIAAEEKWRKEYREQYGEPPTAAELNVGVYGERMPAFTHTRIEHARLKARALLARVPTAHIIDIVKYATAVTIGLAAYHIITGLL